MDNTDNRKSKKYRIYKKLSKLYSELTKVNESVIQELEKRNVQKAYDHAEKVVGLERNIESITKKDSSRAWLTFSEMERYTKKNISIRHQTPIYCYF